MPPKKGKTAKKKQAPAKSVSNAGGSRSSTPTGDLSGTAFDQKSGGDVPRDPITVAFSLGSENATLTLLPTGPGSRGEIIANEDGERQIPAIVSFSGDEVVCCDMHLISLLYFPKYNDFNLFIS
jgi:L1 cell adhesion molecule like protein